MALHAVRDRQAVRPAAASGHTWFPICDDCDSDATAAAVERSRPIWHCDRHRRAADTALATIRAGHAPTTDTAWQTITHHCQGIRKPLMRHDIPDAAWLGYLAAGWTPQPQEHPTYATPPTTSTNRARNITEPPDAPSIGDPVFVPGHWEDGTPFPEYIPEEDL